MEIHDENKYMISVRLMKITKIYELFDPKHIKLYGYNVCRTVNYVFISINVMVSLASCWSVYCCLDDYYNAIMYLMMSFVFAYNSFKTYYLISNSEAIWDCLDFTSVEFLSGGHYRRDTLRAGRTRCVKFTNIFAALWTVACVSWMISPLLINDFDRHTRITADVISYRVNVFNFLFPVSKEFYDENFVLFYAAECTVMVYNSYTLIIFDIVIVSFFMTIGTQLETISFAFESLGHGRSFCNSKDNRKTMTEDELSTIKSLKSIVRDHQRVIEKTRAVYKIFKQIVLIMIAVESHVLVFQSFTLITGFMDGRLFNSLAMLKLLLSLFVYLVHLFAVCFLLSNINKLKSDITFSLYCCNWTEMGIEFKKILFFAMLMNDTEKSTLKITAKKIVNLEMFASVMHMCYSIISVMVKSKQSLSEQ